MINKLVDKLENEGIVWKNNAMNLEWETLQDNELKINCLKINYEYLTSSDGVLGSKDIMPIILIDGSINIQPPLAVGTYCIHQPGFESKWGFDEKRDGKGKHST